jgi:hypothetical protein
VQQPVSQGRFTVVDVGNDAEVADMGSHTEESILDFSATKGTKEHEVLRTKRRTSAPLLLF